MLPATATASRIPLLLPLPNPHYASPPSFLYHGTPSGGGGTATDSSSEERGPPSGAAVVHQRSPHHHTLPAINALLVIIRSPPSMPSSLCYAQLPLTLSSPP
uniref:Uncharacterized protein n=1 Tax=Zea mays TaxID=4577 RepID=A0A804LL52_MAIZE